jgi:hypothetical protein
VTDVIGGAEERAYVLDSLSQEITFLHYIDLPTDTARLYLTVATHLSVNLSTY